MKAIGSWSQSYHRPCFHGADMSSALEQIREPIHIVGDPDEGTVGIALGGSVSNIAETPSGTHAWYGTLPPIYPEWLGDRSFLAAHRLRFPYVVGEMATGIATAAMVIAAGRAGMLGFFGSAGLGLEVTEKAMDEIERALPDSVSWGTNLIHSPGEPELEMATVELFLRRGVRRVSASAFMGITPAIVRYALSGVRRDRQNGRVIRVNHVFAKISRTEVALPFLLPAPQAIADALVTLGYLTQDEAQLAQEIPIAEDITVEADSGGHTDNRPLNVLLPTILRLRDEIALQRGYASPPRVGASGGLGVPSAVAAAFALGAAYVMTGSINQSALEAGTSAEVKKVLSETGMADVLMAPAADMFELGVKVQVLKRGTLFGMRAQFLYDVYTRHEDLDSIPSDIRVPLERDIFREPLEKTWERTRAYWMERNPEEVARAEREPKHRMALCFRSYLGEASRWARFGDPTRKLDYQIWCGPAMGAFNAWVKGTFLESPENRTVAQIGFNLLEGAAVVTRTQQLRAHAVDIAPGKFDYRPRPLA